MPLPNDLRDFGLGPISMAGPLSRPKTLYDAVIAAGAKFGEDYDHHESDLYLRATMDHVKLLREYDCLERSSLFINDDGEPWIDVPFAYSPFWRAIGCGGGAKHG